MKQILLAVVFLFLGTHMAQASGKIILEPTKLLGEKNESEPIQIKMGLSIYQKLGKVFWNSWTGTMAEPSGVGTEHEYKYVTFKNGLGIQPMDHFTVELGHQMNKNLDDGTSQNQIYARLATQLW